MNSLWKTIRDGLTYKDLAGKRQLRAYSVIAILILCGFILFRRIQLMSRLEIPVSFIPPHPDFTEWRVDAYGEPSVVYALRGCFRTSSIIGNRLEAWGGDIPVICVVIEDAENTRVVYQLGEHIYTAPATPTRSFLLFGYGGDGAWVWLGTQSDPKIEIDDAAQYANDRLTIATLYDSQPWDMQWLKRRYSLEMKALPEGWITKTDEMDKQAILSGLNNSVEGGG